MQNAASQQFQPPTTLSEFNAQLRDLQLPQLHGQASLRAILAVADKTTIVQSLYSAATPGHRHASTGRSFLLNAVNRANTNAVQQPADQGQPDAGSRPQLRSVPSANEENERFRDSPPARMREDTRDEPSTQGDSRRGTQHHQHDRQSSQGPSQADQASYRAQVKVYGGKAALCVEADTTSRLQTPTVKFELALSTGPKEYDWGTKLLLQLTKSELPMACAVFMGKLPRFEMKNHGPDSSKWLQIEHQGGSIFVKGGAKDVQIRALPVGAADAFYVAGLLLKQLQAALQGMEMTGVLALVGSVAAPMAAAQSTPRQHPAGNR